MTIESQLFIKPLSLILLTEYPNSARLESSESNLITCRNNQPNHS